MKKVKEDSDIIIEKLDSIEKKIETQNILLAMLINPKQDDQKSNPERIWELHKMGFSNEVISIILSVAIKTVINRIGEKKKELNL